MELYLLRHGDAEPRGTLTSDAERALTAKGKRDVEAVAAQAKIGNVRPDVVLTSPMSRAIDTCHEAGLGAGSRVELDLGEWNYGIYEGRTTAEIRQGVPGWTVWNSPMPEGESIEQIQARANALIERLLAMSGRIALFSHGHFLRVLGGCWMNGLAMTGAHLLLDTATVSVLGFERETRALRRWNSRGD